LKGLQGQSLTIDAGPWRATLIDFWASWCTPCRLSFPWMNSLHKRLSERGLRILAINLDRRREDAVRFLSAHPARFEIALDPTAQSASALNIQAMPTSMGSMPFGVERPVLTWQLPVRTGWPADA
jgi:thiol-disulfide isomerase/thioredoxin